MATLLSKQSEEKNGDRAVNEEFQEDFSMEALDTDDTLTIGEIAAEKAEEEPFGDVDGGVIGPGSGVAGAALSPRDWHLEDFNMEALDTKDTLTIALERLQLQKLLKLPKKLLR
jgi:hypothetical protein